MNKFIKQNVNYDLVKLILCIWIMLSIVFMNSRIVHAEESDSSAKTVQKPENDVGFTVEPVLPATQIDQSKGFFFTKVKPGEPQDIKVRIRSTNVKPAKVKVYVKDAHTNLNGAIDYDNDDYKRDKTLKQSLEDITTVSQKEVTVQNYEVKEITIRISPPEKSFQGVKGGAVCIMKADSNKVKEGLSSSFGYRIGLLVTEDSKIYDDGSSLNCLKVKPTVQQGKRVIQVGLQNPEAKVLDNLSVETKLREKGKNEVLRKRTTNAMRMAPNSQFDFATNWGLDPIRPGTYILSVRAKSNDESWKWEKEFTIGEKEANKINEEAVYTITYPKWVPIVVILLGLVTLINIGCLYVRRKKWNESK